MAMPQQLYVGPCINKNSLLLCVEKTVAIDTHYTMGHLFLWQGRRDYPSPFST